MKKEYGARSAFYMLLIFLFTCIFYCTAGFHVLAVEETSTKEQPAVSASLSAQTVKVGDTVKVKSSQSGLTYKSSDTRIAYVDAAGNIIGKKSGTVTITVKKSGYKSKKLSLTVAKKSRKPIIPVLWEEVDLANDHIEGNSYFFHIKNNALSDIRKLSVTLSLVTDTGELEMTYETGTVKSGTLSETYALVAPEGVQVSEAHMKEMKIYAKNSLVTYHAQTGKITYGWGTKDRTAPVISGLVGKNSYHGKECYITLYKDLDFDFSKHIKAVDERDGNVKVSVDTSGIDYNSPGIYTLPVTAQDKAGNQAKTYVMVEVRKVGEADEIADEILSDIVKSSWSDEKKIRAIYDYVAKHISYSHSTRERDWPKEAVYCYYQGVGDCFSYFSLSKAMFNRLGIPNLRVKRNTKQPHYWNMVRLENGWYHYDACRRQVWCYLCLLTDKQLQAFSKYYESISGFPSNSWDADQYPASAKKKLTKKYRR